MTNVPDIQQLGRTVIAKAVTRRKFERAAVNPAPEAIKRAVGRFKQSDKEFTQAVDNYVKAGQP